MHLANGNRNPYVFVVGCPRSGTTLLKRMLDAHPQLAITPETHWIPSWFERRTGLTPEGLVTPELVSRLLEYPRFSQLGIQREPLERLLQSEVAISYARSASGLSSRYG